MANTASSRQSLSDRLKNKKDEEENKEETSSSAETDKDVDNNEDKKTETDLDKPSSVVVEEGKHVDEQADREVDSEGNPNGVNFSEERRTNVINKTPAELSAETPEETKRRYGISDEVPDVVNDNPNVTIDRENRVQQIAAGTHLHPDVAKDTYNSSVGGRPSESAQVTVQRTQLVFATEAEVDDKGFKNPNVNDR